MTSPSAVLLPVRVETRFVERQLWLRVFPDQIGIDMHEPRLSEREIEAGQRYWRELWALTPDDRPGALAAWRALAGDLTAPRAAYVAQHPALVPANVAGRPAGAPEFAAVPAEAQRPPDARRPARAAALPDRWTVVLARDGRERSVLGGPIVPDLAVAPDPSAGDGAGEGGLPIDEGMGWLVDFDVAVEAGMAMRIDLRDDEARGGFDRVLVHGVSAEAKAGAQALAALLTSHRFSDGLALVPQGTPTNNAAEAPAGFTREDSGHERSFRVERQGPLDQQDGAAVAAALGVPPETFAHAEHADGTGGRNGREMAVALWPATLGYFLTEMMAETFTAADVAAARSYVLAHVRGRGTVPAIRVGDTPYGVLPATSLRLHRASAGEEARVADGLAGFLRRVLPTWRRSAEAVPHVTRGGDPDAELTGVLSMDAGARGYRVRDVLGGQVLAHSLSWLQLPGADSVRDAQAAAGRDLLDRYGLGEWDPRVLRMSVSAKSRLLRAPLVQAGPLSESEGLAPVALPDGGTGNYISWLRRAPIEHVRDDEHHFPGGPPRTLLYRLLRQSLLVEYGQAAFQWLVDRGEIVPEQAREIELVGFERGEQPPPRPGGGVRVPLTRARTPGAATTGRAAVTIWEALEQKASGPGAAGAGPTIAQRLQQLVRPGGLAGGRLGDLVAGFDWLAGLPTAELERLMTETLDTFGHRLDPWITSLASQRLEASRGGDGEAAPLVQVGGYGWLEDLRPAAARGEDRGGYVHAPSLPQAAAAAVLRNGFVTHRGTADGELLAVDLSSRRMRLALSVLDGIRQGQSLPALLGYRFERTLHDGGAEVLVQPLRDRFPLMPPVTPLADGAAEAVAASNVVHGLDLHAAWREGTLALGGTAAEQQVAERALRDLDDLLDAIGDLSIAESVYQIVRGNPVRAGGLLDAIGRGERPPEPEVLASPRGGVDVTHRLALVLPEAGSRSAAWPGAGHPRAKAEPRLDAWLSRLLPAPDRVRCEAVWEAAGGDEERAPITLADLELAPVEALDLVAALELPEGSELERRAALRAAELAPPGPVRVSFDRDSGWPDDALTFPEFLLVARAARDLLGGARPLAPQDLAEQHLDAALHGGTVDVAELEGRASTAAADLDAAVAAIADGLSAAEAAGEDEAALAAAEDDLRAALFAAGAFGLPDAVPAPPGESPTAVERAPAILAELRRRAEAAAPVPAADDARREEALRRLRAVFGEGFVACPRLSAPDPDALQAALDGAGALLGGDGGAPARWLQGLTHVRDGVSRWDLLAGAARLAGGEPGEDLSILQLPHEDGARWAALRGELPAGRLSIAAFLPGDADLGAPLAGLMLDEWTDRVPATEATTGVAFHYDQPGVRAPQAILVAVPPDDRSAWDGQALTAVLDETLDLAKVRTVDLEALDDGGQILPALYLPFNTADEAASVDVGALLTPVKLREGER